MFPSVVSNEKAVRGIIAALAVLIASSYTLVPWTKTLFYPLVVTLINAPLAVAGYRFYRSKTNKAGWWIFKLTAPQIVVVLLAFMAERLLFA
jgi:heme O synthase-like polyprenyltransferase